MLFAGSAAPTAWHPAVWILGCTGDVGSPASLRPVCAISGPYPHTRIRKIRIAGASLLLKTPELLGKTGARPSRSMPPALVGSAYSSFVRPIHSRGQCPNGYRDPKKPSKLNVGFLPAAAHAQTRDTAAGRTRSSTRPPQRTAH